MATGVRPGLLTPPLFVIDTCLSDDNNQQSIAIKTKTTTTTITPKDFHVSRSWSLPNRGDTYKDLRGSNHLSFCRRLNNLSHRSRSCPDIFPTLLLHSLMDTDETLRLRSPSPSASVNFSQWLHPHAGRATGGIQTPGSSSSRYSLYGSFFDLSESGYCPPSNQSLIKSHPNKLLTFDGRPLLVVDNSFQSTTNTYQDKCTNWLRHLNETSI